MKNLTLVIPAKNEEASLPSVLNELKNYDCSVFDLNFKKLKKINISSGASTDIVLIKNK